MAKSHLQVPHFDCGVQGATKEELARERRAQGRDDAQMAHQVVTMLQSHHIVQLDILKFQKLLSEQGIMHAFTRSSYLVVGSGDDILCRNRKGVDRSVGCCQRARQFQRGGIKDVYFAVTRCQYIHK